MKTSRWKILFGLSGALLMAGCGSMFSSSDPFPTEPGFTGGATPAKNALPLPVEIAEDIAEITENGVLIIDPQKVAEQTVEKKKEKNEDQNKEQNEPKEFKSNGPLGKKSGTQGPLGFVDKTNAQLKGKTINYLVKLGDTLMKVAFEKHGNYLRWKEIYSVNRKKMTHYTKMKVGTVLTIKNVRYVFIRKKGRPYLIRKGDTLKSIAAKVYGNSKNWKKIWKNNPQLIKNPKKLYAGFTLYYETASGEPTKIRKPTSSQ